jgi:hypothetical protein
MTPFMIDKIKDIFADKIGNANKLAGCLRKHPEVVSFCEAMLLREPAYEKVSYVVICIVKRVNFE